MTEVGSQFLTGKIVIKLRLTFFKYCTGKIGDLKTICWTPHGWSFLFVANYEIFVGQIKILKIFVKAAGTNNLCAYWWVLFIPVLRIFLFYLAD